MSENGIKMKFMRSKSVLIILIALLLAACESGPRVKMAPGYEITETPVRSSANVLGTPLPTRLPPTPTVPPLALDTKAYWLPSLTLSFNMPQKWTQDFEDEYYAKFTSPDNTAWMEAAVESSSYELSPEEYQTYVDNMVTSLYSGAKDYKLLRREDSGARTMITSVFMKGDQKWYSMDFFLKRAQALYALSFQAHETVWESYKNTFQEISDTVKTQTGYLKPEQIYKFRKKTQSPSGSFELTVPLGWSQSKDEESLDNARIDTFASPDEEAWVEMIILNDAELMAQKDIGQITIGLLKEKYGNDLRFLSDEVLEDGRIRTDWKNNRTKTSGFTYFWLNGSELNILTLGQTNDHPEAYQNLLEQIGSSLVFLKN